MSVMRYRKGLPAAREAPDVQSTQNMSRGQLEKLVAKNAKSGQYDLQRSWCQALQCRNALQHASQLDGQVATAMSRDAHGHMDIMGCTGVSRHVQGWTKLAGVEYNGMSGLTTVSLLGRTNTSCTCVSVHPSHCPL